MSAYKNQHFVPRRALRLFGHPGGRSIDLFNLRRRTFIPNASIGDQCSKPFFYLKSGDLEPAFAETENKGLDVLEDIAATGVLPSNGAAAHHDLIRYVAFQGGRTLGAASKTQDWSETVAKKMLEESLKEGGDPEGLLQHLPKLRIIFNNVPLENVYRSVTSSPLLADLAVGLFQAGVGQEFVLGDDPVVLTNAFRIEAGVPLCGLACRGLIILCPITPTRVLVLYDSEAYRLRAHPLHRVECMEMNSLQIASAYANVYLRNKDLVADSCAAVIEPLRAQDLSVVRSEDDGRTGITIGHFKSSLALGPGLAKRFIVRSNAKRGTYKVGNDVLRNPALADLIRKIGSDPEAFKSIMRTPP